MTSEIDIRAEQIRAEQLSYRKFVELELRSLVRELGDMLSRDDQPDWELVRLHLSSATGKAAEIIAFEKRNAQAQT